MHVYIHICQHFWVLSNLMFAGIFPLYQKHFVSEMVVVLSEIRYILDLNFVEL